MYDKKLTFALGLRWQAEDLLSAIIENELVRVRTGDCFDCPPGVDGALSNAVALLEESVAICQDNAVGQALNALRTTISDCEKKSHPSWREAYVAATALGLITRHHETVGRWAHAFQREVHMMLDPLY